MFCKCRQLAWRKEVMLAWCSILQHPRADLVVTVERPKFGVTARRKGFLILGCWERERRLQAFANRKGSSGTCFVLCAAFTKRRSDPLRISVIPKMMMKRERTNCKGLLSSLFFFDPVHPACDPTTLLEQLEAGAMSKGSYGESMHTSSPWTFAALVIKEPHSRYESRPPPTIQPSIF